MKNNYKNGFSLLEVLVFISILSLFFFSAITVSVYAMKNLRVSQQRIFASKYAEELSEFLLSEKDLSWTAFQSRATSIVQNGGCLVFDTADISWASTIKCSAPTLNGRVLLDNLYERDATFEVNASQVIVTISVYWSDGKGGSYSVPLKAVYTQ